MHGQETPSGQYQPGSNHDIFAAMTISHNQPVMFTAKRYARLKWACRRDMLELDVLLLPFVLHVPVFGCSAVTLVVFLDNNNNNM